MVGIYESLADMYDKRIDFDFHEELKTVEIFAKAIDSGVMDFADQHFGSPLIPDWKRVESAIDGILQDLVAAVELE
jgi:glucosyl-3-phosphoglycerate synthase